VAKNKKPKILLETTPTSTPIEVARNWLRERNIEDIECILPDQAGVARGKMMPVEKFLASPVMTMPGSVLTQTIAGEYPPNDEAYQNDPADHDIHLQPDFSTLTAVPWEEDPTAQILHDAYHADGSPVEVAGS
jgi:glutamine synthetase